MRLVYIGLLPIPHVLVDRQTQYAVPLPGKVKGVLLCPVVHEKFSVFKIFISDASS